MSIILFSAQEWKLLNIQSDFLSNVRSIFSAISHLPDNLCAIMTYVSFLVSVASWATPTITVDTDNEDASLAGNDASSTNSYGTGVVHRHYGICAGCGSGLNLLGFNWFMRGKAVDGLGKAGKANNPINLRIVGIVKILMILLNSS